MTQTVSSWLADYFMKKKRLLILLLFKIIFYATNRSNFIEQNTGQEKNKGEKRKWTVGEKKEEQRKKLKNVELRMLLEKNKSGSDLKMSV